MGWTTAGVKRSEIWQLKLRERAARYRASDCLTVKNKVVPVAAVIGCFFVALAGLIPGVQAQSNLAVRVMAANTTSGTQQSYEGPGIRIFQGLRPDIVAIQEFQYNSSSASNDLRTLVNTAFGSEFSFYVEPSGSIPNGIVSRWPIVAAGAWDDPLVSDRGFAWAQIDLPGTNDLYVISVHLYGSGSASDRGAEAALIKAHVQTSFPANAWVVVGGDMNTTARSEAAISTFTTFLSDSPVPTDLTSGGNPDTNEPRNKPYDYVLPSAGLATYRVPTVIGAQTFNNGLVFDSSVYNSSYTLASVAPVQSGDSHVTGMQHMAVVKDFLIPVGVPVTNAPSITAQPQSQTNIAGANVAFNVVAAGSAPLAYQWRFFGTNLPGVTASSLSLTNIQAGNVGDYTVVVTNSVGSVTSAVATLTLSSGLLITNQPQGLSVLVGQSAAFAVGVSGTAPLSYQWRFNAGPITGATNASFTRTNAQMADAGSYTVVVTNTSGSVTSAAAVLSVNEPVVGTLTTLAGWDVNAQTNFGFSPFPPTTNAANLTIVGLSRGSGVLTPSGAASRAWGGTSWDSTSASAAATAGDYATFSITPTAGFKVSFSTVSKFDYRRSSTGPSSGVLQYQVGSGAFTDITTLAYTNSTSSGSSIGAIDLSSISALQSVPTGTAVTFRIVNYAATGSGGTWYVFDVGNSTAVDFAVSGIVSSVVVSNPPAQSPALGSVVLTNNQFQFQLTGTTSSNYIVQAATDLGLSNWVSLRTNAAPFTFAETNVLALPQRYYRGLVAP